MPKHGIPGVKTAHPAQYRFCEKERRTQIQRNWERFLRNNPGYRPAPAPWGSPAPCIIHNIAAEAPRARCIGLCINKKARRRLDELLDHEEPWHVVNDEHTVPVLFGHPYIVNAGYGDELMEFLKELPEGAGEKLAIYMSKPEDSWYVAPTEGLFIQSRRIPPPRGWFEVTAHGTRWVPHVSTTG